MAARIEGRFEGRYRYEGFEPVEWVYRIGDSGYVSETDWERAFEGEPAWAKDMFFLVMDDSGAAEEGVRLWNAGMFDEFDELVQDVVGESDWCFGTEATETGEV